MDYSTRQFGEFQSMNYPEIPPEAFGTDATGGRRPTDDELRFWRLIEERTPGPPGEGWEEIKLACGHSFKPFTLNKEREYAFCSICYLDSIILEHMLKCPFCGFEQEAVMPTIELYICANCDKSVEVKPQ